MEVEYNMCSVSLKGKVLDFESNDVGSSPTQSKRMRFIFLIYIYELVDVISNEIKLI